MPYFGLCFVDLYFMALNLKNNGNFVEPKTSFDFNTLKLNGLLDVVSPGILCSVLNAISCVAMTTLQPNSGGHFKDYRNKMERI